MGLHSVGVEESGIMIKMWCKQGLPYKWQIAHFHSNSGNEHDIIRKYHRDNIYPSHYLSLSLTHTHTHTSLA